MVTLIDTLINKQDNFEIVRDQIAGIITAEQTNQYALAVAEPVPNPEDWVWNTYLERSRPWEALVQSADENSIIYDETPLVNIWFDTGSFPKSKGNSVNRQAMQASYNIDVYAAAVSSDNQAGGYDSGDELASLRAQRILKLCRNILMADVNTYLQLRGIVWQRWPSAITMFQPQQNDLPAQHIIAGRFVLDVSFNEFAPSVTPETLESIYTTIKRQADGKVLLELEYDTTTP